MRSILHYFQQVPTNGDQPVIQRPPPPPAILAFTDGSFKNNAAGCAVVFPDHQEHNYASRLRDGTNNRAEYIALIKAIEISNNSIDPTFQRELIVHTDSELLVNTINKWMQGWKRKGWTKADGRPVKNLDLVKQIDTLLKTRKVFVRHVRAHTNRSDFCSKWNAVADKLAKQASAKPLQSLQEIN